MKLSLLHMHGEEPTTLCPRCQSTSFYRDEFTDVDGFMAVCPSCAREIVNDYSDVYLGDEY